MLSPGSLPHLLDQYILVTQLDSFKYNNSGFLEPVFQVKSDFQDVSGTLSSEYGFTGPNQQLPESMEKCFSLSKLPFL